MSHLRAAAARTRAITVLPTLSTSSHRPITTHGNDPKSNREKRPSLPQMDNAPGWNEDLATPSEASVKADRETTNLDQMQQRTVDYMHPSDDPEVEQTHANYARDEVGGPLGNAGVGEFEGVVGNDDLGPDDAQVESNGRVVTRRTTSHEKTTAHKNESGASQANA